MRTPREFLARAGEYGFLSYTKSCHTIGDDAEFCDTLAFDLLKDGLHTIVLFQLRMTSASEEDDDLVTLIGAYEPHRKLLNQIVKGIDTDDEE